MARWRSPLDNLENLAAAINDGERVRLLYGDLRDGVAVRHVVREASPDVVFHLAAQSFPRTSFESPLDTFETNIQGTVRVLESLREFALRRRVPCLCVLGSFWTGAERSFADNKKTRLFIRPLLTP